MWFDPHYLRLLGCFGSHIYVYVSVNISASVYAGLYSYKHRWSPEVITLSFDQEVRRLRAPSAFPMDKLLYLTALGELDHGNLPALVQVEALIEQLRYAMLADTPVK